MMKAGVGAMVLAAILGVGAVAAVETGFDLAGRTELRRTDLEGSPGMEVVLSVVELKPGDAIPAHFHHGVETGYVLEGGMIEMPGKAATAMEPGASILNQRGVTHGGFKVVGDQTIKLLTVHVVDKNKPLYDWVADLTAISADVNGDGVADVITLVQNASRATVKVTLGGGRPGTSSLEFGVNESAQNALCALPATLVVEDLACASKDASLPGCDPQRGGEVMRLSAGDCDAMHLYWDARTNKLAWWRQ